MPRGGARPNSGPEKGTKYKPTLEKERAREALRAVVLRHMERILRSQIAAACGIDHFFLRDPKSGQFIRVTDPEQIEKALNEGEKDSYYWIFTKDPDPRAAKDLFDRALDKAKEQETEIHVSGQIDLIASKLGEARKRRSQRTITVQPVRAELPPPSPDVPIVADGVPETEAERSGS